MYENGRGVTQDYAEAVRWYRLAAEQDYARGQTNLGFMYDNGHGVTQDYAEAVRWFRLAAEQDNATAQGNLGFMYFSRPRRHAGLRGSRPLVPTRRRPGRCLLAAPPRQHVHPRSRRGAAGPRGSH